MQETWVGSLDQEDPLEKEMATHSSTHVENSMDRGARQALVLGVAKSQTRLSDFTFYKIYFAGNTDKPFKHLPRSFP